MGRPQLLTPTIEMHLTQLIQPPDSEIRKVSAKEAMCHLKGLVQKNVIQPPLPGEKRIAKAVHDITVMLNNNNSELDSPWTVGSCMKNNIPGDMIPILLGIQRNALENRKGLLEGADKLSKKEIEFRQQVAERGLLTIRQAKWTALLWPALVTNATKQMPKGSDPLSYANRIFAKAKLYAYRERIAEIKGVEYPDTSDIDVSIGDFSDSIIFKSIFTYTGVLDDADKKHHIKLDEKKTSAKRDQGQNP